jgi:hypothetical protein
MRFRIATHKPTSTPFDVVNVCSRQFPNPSGLQLVGDVSTLAHASRRVSFDQPGSGKGFQVPIQARSTNVQHILQLPDSGWTQYCQLTQDVRLRPTAHETYCSFNTRRQVGSDQSRHKSILPDSPRPRPLIIRLTLSINNRVGLYAMQMLRHKMTSDS